ncbi:PREDICTED: uncharacterized protein LOC104784413 [Camelina sativa]|uniref:Uncharacterized protein LOC104784413 n=1 Tax=Camelina sativa TaxID=90675 RepID=A0ABM0YY25_CAMSA|nr:PREDICTED: uncharacterized protein LOC104784413 [Camelina sativa]
MCQGLALNDDLQSVIRHHDDKTKGNSAPTTAPTPIPLVNINQDESDDDFAQLAYSLIVPRSKSPEQALFTKPVYDQTEQLPPAPWDTQETRKYPTSMYARTNKRPDYFQHNVPQQSSSGSDSSYDDLVEQSRNLSLNPTASAAAPVTPPKKDDKPEDILFKDLIEFAKTRTSSSSTSKPNKPF